MVHDGHRERLRKKAENGVLETHERLELFLFGVLPRVNTNETAHRLLDRFGGITGLFGASIDRLRSVEGIGNTAALSIRNLSGLTREYMLGLCHTSELLTCEFELYKYLCALFAGSCHEKAYMLMFSDKNKYLGYKLLGEGTTAGVHVVSRHALLYALKCGAKSVIIAHNHPDGVSCPSDADIESSWKLNVKFQNAGIAVREYFVVADGRCIPFSDKVKKWRKND